MASSSTDETPNASDEGLSPRLEKALWTASKAVLQGQDEAVSNKFNMGKAVPMLCKEFRRQGFKSIEKVLGITEEIWQDKFKKFPKSLLAFVKKAIDAQDAGEAATEHATEEAVATYIVEGVATAHAAEEATATQKASAIAKTDTMIELCTPPLSFGDRGRPQIKLVTNHFLLQVKENQDGAVWVSWQVEFPTEETVRPAGWFKPTRRGASGPGRSLRIETVRKHLSSLPKTDWVYDGGARLYTSRRLSKESERRFRGPHEVVLDGSRSPLKISIVEATDENTRKQQELDLMKLGRVGSERANKSVDPIEAVRVELQFLQIALRSFAIDELNLVARGRRVIDPSGALVSGMEQSLKNGRELWMGYLANLEIINGLDGPTSARFTLSLNLSASVGLPGMSALELLAHLIAGSMNKPGDFKWYHEILWKDQWPRQLSEQLLQTLRGDTGLRKVKVRCGYFADKQGRKYSRNFTIVGISSVPASKLKFPYNGQEITVADYFQSERKIPLWCPGLPCLELTKPGNWVPIELATVLGGEHNLLVGKLHPDYQGAISTRTTMSPGDRCNGIQSAIANVNLGPRRALASKGIDLRTDMLSINGHILDAPVILDGRKQSLTPNNYSNKVAACSPPEYTVQWALWSFIQPQYGEIESFVKAFTTSGFERGLRFADRPNGGIGPYESWKTFEQKNEPLEDALLKDLESVQKLFHNQASSLLVILLPPKGPRTDDAYKLIKYLTETNPKLCSFATQCINVPHGTDKKGNSGMKQVERKLNNIMVKLPGKLPAKDSEGSSGAYHVRLQKLHPLLNRETIVLGADVTHGAAGVSIAGVVATCADDFSTYFAEVRAQSSKTLGSAKCRSRKSEERIVDISDITEALLKRWRQQAGGHLPSTVLYYRDGVSDTQFKPVLTFEHDGLVKAFKSIGGASYDPQVIIVVGQKRHQTRLFREDVAKERSESSAKGDGGWKGKSSDKGKGKTSGKGGFGDSNNVPPGTVASRGLAQTGHLNFFLVSHQGIKGTSIPCHYHVLHVDPRLKEINADALERITYDLCHLYPRADKTVSYAAPAYLADHLCERGKLYLETKFGDELDESLSQPISDDSDEKRKTEQIQDRVDWFNARLAEVTSSRLQGRNFFC